MLSRSILEVTAAVVSYAPEVERGVGVCVSLNPFGKLAIYLAENGVVTLVGAVYQNLGFAVVAFPEEVLVVEVVVSSSGTDVDVVLVAAFVKHLYKTLRVTERVEVDGGYGNLIKFVVEVYSSAEHLTEYSLAGGNVAVWLKEPTADYVPSSVRYLSLYLLKQLRLVFPPPIRREEIRCG